MLDLLAIDARDRWVVIELKAGRLDSGTLHQALYYASSLARLSADELCAKLEPGLKEFGDAGMLSARVRQLLDSEADGGAREIAVALVGVGVTADLERMQEFLGRFKMSIDVVSFEVFELAGGPRLLIREVTEEHADAPSRPRPERSVEAIRQRAAAERVLEPFDRFIGMSEDASLFVRPYTLSTPGRMRSRSSSTSPSKRQSTRWTRATWISSLRAKRSTRGSSRYGSSSKRSCRHRVTKAIVERRPAERQPGRRRARGAIAACRRRTAAAQPTDEPPKVGRLVRPRRSSGAA